MQQMNSFFDAGFDKLMPIENSLPYCDCYPTRKKATKAAEQLRDCV